MVKHKRFEENILVDEAYTNYGRADQNEDRKKSQGIAKNFAESLEYDEKKKWFHQLPEEPPTSSKTLTQQQIEELRKEASSALHGDTLAYETKTNRSGSSDHQWAKTLLNKGAIGDRVAAATILIQDNPVYNMNALKNLINNVKPAKKKDGIVIIDALSELLVSDLLIPDIKLRTFEQHPLAEVETMTSGNKHSRRQLLQLWYYEDQLKELYGTYVEALNKFAHDSVEANKEKAVSAMSYLLMHHPEREKMLLTNIINKLGDPSQSVASKVIYHLCQLLFNHPNMKSVVLNEIEKMLFRTNISSRAQYYGICFLNQFYLGKDDSKIAENLIRIYFSFFKASIKKGDIDSRLMSAILTGVKRAYPFADKERLSTNEHTDAIHKLVHMSKINIAVHALALLFHVSDAGDEARDRYYNALYRKLANSEIYNTSHSALLFNLLYKSLKQDKNTGRVAAFVKRLLQASCQASPAQCCALLFLISQVTTEKSKRSTKQLNWEPSEVKEEIKEEPKKETIDVADQNESVQEVTDIEVKNDEVKEEKKVKVDLLKGDKKDLLLDDDEETYVDLELDASGNVQPAKKASGSQPTAQPDSWVHKPLQEDPGAKARLRKTANMDRVITQYFPHARNPSFAGAEHTAYFELSTMATHFHPTVKLFAEKLLDEQIIQYSGDPLKDFSGIRFLDRFVFKNPKKRSEEHDGDGPKKVKGSHPKFAVRKNYVAKGIKSIPVNSATYLNEDVKRIPVDERFLYDFLRKRREAKKDEDDDSDNDSVNSDDFNEYLDTLTGTRKDESDEELDFLSEMEAAKQNHKEKKSKDDESDDELGSGDDEEGGEEMDPSDDDDGDSDGGLDIQGSDDEPMGLSGEEDELQLEGSDSDDEKIEVPSKKSKNKLKLNLKGKDDLGSLFASAEEFSTLLEDTASNKKQGSSQAVSNTDNSSVKQLAWEDNRDRWIKGFNRKILGNKGNKKGGKNKKQNGFSKMASKNGGKRRSDSATSVGGKKKKFK